MQAEVASLALRIEGISKTYRSSIQALRHISLTVKEGDFFALLGPNGAGKSTLIGIVTSLVNKSAGKVYVYNYDTDIQLAKAKTCIGIVPQEFNCNIFEKVEDIIIQQAGYYGITAKEAKKNCHTCLHQLDLYDQRKTRAIHLSGGMKRRLMIARALVHKPRLLILDEPTAGVDIEIRRSMWRFLSELNRQGTTIILTTHYLEEAEQLCRNIAILHQGSIIENTSMKKLLRNMHTQTYILDLAQPVSQLPNAKQVDFNRIDDSTIEATIDNNQSINTIFSALTRKNIKIVSMRTKSNRLEELFLSMTSNRIQKQ